MMDQAEEKPPVLDAQPAVLGTPAPYPANVYPPTATVPAYSAGPPPYQNPVVIQVAPGIPKRPSFRQMIPVPVHRGAVYGSSHGNALLIAVMVTMFSLFCGFLPLSCAIPAVALAFLATDASDVQTKRNLNFASRMCSALACGGVFLCVVAFTVWIGLSNTRNCRDDRGDRYSCD